MLKANSLARHAWHAAEQAIARKGYVVEWRPGTLRRRESRLELALEFVLPHLLLAKRKPFFIEIGASDGVTNDPLHPFISRELIRGIRVEPLPWAFQRLSAGHADSTDIRCINAALAAEDGEAPFFTVDMNGINLSSAHQFSSFRRDILLAHRTFVPDIEQRIVETRVPTVSFGTLKRIALDMGAADIDVVHIDTEGFDGAVLDMMWDHGLRPALVSFERAHMSKAEIERQADRLASSGYRLAMGHFDMIAYRAANDLAIATPADTR
jgi:FkbM family methyltransferase